MIEYALFGSRKIPVPTIPFMPRSTILQKPNFPVSFILKPFYYLVIFSRAAVTKAANKRFAFSSVSDIISGWNWQATNQG